MKAAVEDKRGAQRPVLVAANDGASVPRKVMFDFDLAYRRMLSPECIDAFEGSRDGTRVYLSDGTTVTTSAHEPALIAKALEPYLTEPLIAVSLPGITPQHYFVCGIALMGYTQGRVTGISQAGVGPQVQLHVHLRSAGQFIVPQTSALEFEAAIEAAYGVPVLKVRIKQLKEEFVSGGAAGFDYGDHQDLFLARARAVTRG